jgi:YVTN family beta-propeller protein
VSSDRDREVIAVDIASSGNAAHLHSRIKLDGKALGMTLDRPGNKLYVAQDNADQIAVIDTATNTVINKIDARAPAGVLTGENDQGTGGDQQPHYTGAATFAVTILPDGTSLYAVNAGAHQAEAQRSLVGESHGRFRLLGRCARKSPGREDDDVI